MDRKASVLPFLCIVLVVIVGLFLLLRTKPPSQKPPSIAHNAYYFLREHLSKKKNLEMRLQEFPQILKYKKLYFPRAKNGNTIIPSFLEMQVNAKTHYVVSIYRLLHGRRKDALNLLAADYHLGRLLNESNTVIARLVGMAMRSIAIKGLSIYALNACETKDDFLELWTTLAELSLKYNNQSLMDCLRGNARNYLSFLITRITWNKINKDGITHEHVVDARFELLRMATAAKYKLVFDGRVPKSVSDFAPLLSEGLPEDPFVSTPLKFFYDKTNRQFICYSIGPDKVDSKASVEYDPTNGTMSSGDIIAVVSEKREFPFPRDGLRASSAEEVKKLFPNGLPPDNFADTRGKSLGISNTTPVYIYSYGPDTDEADARKLGDKYVPEVMYDPTNGTISEGDLFIKIPPD